MAREMTMEVVVGGFMVMVLLGLAYFTIILSRETWFGEKTMAEVVFDNVMGLREGDSVVVRGMTIGKVQSMALEGDGVHVVASLDAPLAMREDYSIKIVSTSILGGRYLDIYEGSPAARPLSGEAAFRGEKAYDLMADAAELVNAVRRSMVDEGAIESFQDSVLKLGAIITRVEAGEGLLGGILSTDDRIYEDLRATMSSLRGVVGRIEAGDGLLGRLTQGQDTVYDDVAATAASLRGLAGRLDEGKGMLGRLLSEDDQLYQDLSASIASVRRVAERMERGEGLLGRLLSDDKMAEEVDGIIKEVRAAIDDFRETTPVSTFTSIFFGAL
jgi:phospholipid/cholesterol/gamma-HCH transport system substrate-binding protein